MRTLILTLVTLAFLCCEKSTKKAFVSGGNQPLVEVKAETDSSFVPDISINDFVLDDEVSVESQVGDLMPLLNKSESLSTFLLLNRDHNQYLKLVFHPGSVTNRFSEFEVGYFLTATDSKHSKTLQATEFRTESEIRLGIPKQKVIEKKGKNFDSVGANIIKYIIDDLETSSFLKQYNMPLYFAQYEFDSNNVLVKFSFGFEYP